MALAVSMIVRNEAKRHLHRTLNCIEVMNARCFVTDDGSDDDTPEICEDYGAIVRRTEPQFWKHEGDARQQHQDWLAGYLTEGDWVLALDADETVSSPHRVLDVLHMADMLKDGAVALPLYEFWTLSEYRVDGYWFGTTAPVLYKWRPGGIIRNKEMGCGREPTYVQNCSVFHQDDIRLLHWGYLRQEDRVRKHKAYSERLGGHGHSNGHVESIIATPTLVPYVQTGALQWNL